MASVTVKEFAKAWWSEVYNRIIGAVVFLDDASAECLHWDDGLFNLLSGGAVAVKTLSPFESCRKEDKKAVFITQTTWTQVQTICDIIRRSNLTHVIVISCVSLDVFYLEVSKDNDASERIAAGKGIAEGKKLLENTLKESFDGKQCSIVIVPAPILTVSLTNVVFVTPPYQHVYPKCKNQITIDPNVANLYNLLVSERNDARRLASSLSNMLDSMNLKEDIYYMGGYSTILAGILENSPVCLARRKNCSHPASLILVDRTLDVSGVTSHSSESLLDKIMGLLPRFPGHSTEVAVDMSPLCKATNNLSSVDHTEKSELSPGCLYHATDESCIQTYDYMINKSQKEVMFDLYNKLCKLDVQKSPSPKRAKMLLKVTPQSIEKIINASKGNYPVIINHLGVLQQACATVQALKSPQRSQVDLLMSLEKQFQENLATSRDSTTVLQQICHLIETRKDRDLPVDRLMALLVHIYSLKGKEIQFSKTHEDNLEKVLGEAIYEDHKSSLHPPTAGEELGAKEICEKIAKLAILTLKDIANMRANMIKYNIVLKPCETGVGHEYKGVLQQLVEDLVDSERPDMPDLRQKDESLVLKTKDLLRTGLSMLTQKKTRSAKHPLDNPTIIIFVVGGITAEECKRLHRTVITSGVDNTVLIGSTKMVTPIEAMQDILPFRPTM